MTKRIRHFQPYRSARQSFEARVLTALVGVAILLGLFVLAVQGGLL